MTSQDHAYDPGLPQRTEQGRLFGALCTALSEAGVPNVEGKRDGLRKRLERARKYLMLVALMGTWVLNCVPDVTVTRIDKLSFAVLEQFARKVDASGAVSGALVGAVSGAEGCEGRGGGRRGAQCRLTGALGSNAAAESDTA